VHGGHYRAVPPSVILERVEVGGETYVLPAGRVFEEDGDIRGWGYAIIAATTLLSVPGVVDSVRYGSVVDGRGEWEYIINRPLTEEELIILTIIGGTIYAANRIQDTTDGTCEERVVAYDQDDVEKHASRDDKGPIDAIDILEAINNPDTYGKIIEGSTTFVYYLLQLDNGGWMVVKISNNVPFRWANMYNWWFGSVHTPSEGLYESAEDAKEAKQEDHPNEEIDWEENPGDGC
jgi:hypothetical protein